MSRRPLLTRLALAAALALAGAAARAVDVNGSVGAGYVRSDTWSGPLYANVPSWDLDGQLSLAGVPLRPGLLTWNATGDWRRYRSLYSDSASTTDNLSFTGNASLFSDSALSLQLGGGRTWSDFATTGAVDQTGSTRVTSTAARAQYHAELAPTVTASFGKTSLDNHSFGGRSEADSTSLDAGIAQSVGGFQYALNYGTGWSSGTFAPTNYRSHLLNLQSAVELTDGVELRINDQYFLRDPTVSASTNPRFDDNNFSTGVSSRQSERLLYRGDYQYRHFVLSAPGVPGRDTLDHTASAGGEYRASDEWTWNSSLGASVSRDRLGPSEIAGNTEQVGVGARWMRNLGRDQVHVAGGVSGGVQQREGSGTRGAFGGTAGAGFATVREAWTADVSYNGAYSRNLAGEFGSTLGQQLVAGLETIAAGWRVRNALNASATRTDADVGLSSVSRSIALSVTGSRDRHQLQLTGGLTDAATGDLKSPGDGLFVPTEFNTRARFVALTGTTLLTRSISVFGAARYTQGTAPGRARQWEQSLAAQVQYSLGLFTLSFDERYSVGGTGDFDQRANLFFFRITRSFGASL